VSFPVRHVIIQSHVKKIPEIQELMFPTIATIRAAKLDHVAGGQQQLPTGKVMSHCYSKDIMHAGRMYCLQRTAKHIFVGIFIAHFRRRPRTLLRIPFGLGGLPNMSLWWRVGSTKKWLISVHLRELTTRMHASPH
jgi:hypothetical protein